MTGHAIVNKDFRVVNIVVWEGASWKPPEDHYVIQADGIFIGDIYDPKTKTFSRPKE